MHTFFKQQIHNQNQIHTNVPFTDNEQSTKMDYFIIITHARLWHIIIYDPSSMVRA